MAEITKDQVKEIADVARLSITDEEAAFFQEQLSEIITYAEQLDEVDTTDVKPTTYVLKATNVMRKDEVKEGFTQEEALQNAPSKQDGHFKVPSILD